MAIVKKPPETVEPFAVARKTRQRTARRLLPLRRLHRRTTSQTSRCRKCSSRDPNTRSGRPRNERLRRRSRRRCSQEARMIQRLLHSKNLIACVLAAATGLTPVYKGAVPGEQFLPRTHFSLGAAASSSD